MVGDRVGERCRTKKPRSDKLKRVCTSHDVSKYRYCVIGTRLNMDISAIASLCYEGRFGHRRGKAMSEVIAYQGIYSPDPVI